MPSICGDDMSCIWIERLNLWVGQDVVKDIVKRPREKSVDFGEGGAESPAYLEAVICWLEITDLEDILNYSGPSIMYLNFTSAGLGNHNSSQIHVCWRGLPSCQVRHVTAQLFYISQSPCLDAALLASKTRRNKCLFILQALSLWNSKSPNWLRHWLLILSLLDLCMFLLHSLCLKSPLESLSEAFLIDWGSQQSWPGGQQLVNNSPGFPRT